MVGRTQVDGCDACGGLWFDADEVFRVARGGQEAVAGAEAVVEPPPAGAGMEPAEMVCPRCDSPLFDTAADPSDLHLEVNPHVDHCCECGGIWLELAALSVLVDVPLEWLREWQARLDAAVAGNAMNAAGEALCPVWQRARPCARSARSPWMNAATRTTRAYASTAARSAGARGSITAN